jgi:hypothetical protein
MIRRDYLLRQIEEFVAAIAKMAVLAKNQQWQEASKVAGSQFQALAGADAAELLKLSGTDLLARVVQGEPTHVVENKIFMLATLFKAQGDVLAGGGQPEESQPYYLKGLHLLLNTFAQSQTSQRPDFLPTVEAFLIGLHDSPLPVETHAMLMRHYEQIGEFSKAEDALFAMVETEPANAELLNFGISFYQRLFVLNDVKLAEGNLPRAEVNAGLAELKARKAGLSPV